MIKLLLLLFYSLSLGGCNFGNDYENGYSMNSDTIIIFKKFPQKTSVKFEAFLKPEQTYVRGIFLTDTSIILTDDKNFSSDYFFHEYSLATKNLVGKYIKGGTKRNMTLSPISFGLYQKSELFIKDISLGKVIVASLMDKYSFDSIATEDYPSRQFNYTEQLLDSNRILKSSILDTLPELLQITDLKNDTVIKSFGHLPPASDNVPFGSWKHANMNFLFIKPDGSKAVLAWRYADKIEILNLGTEKSIVTKGPENIEPAFLPIKAGSRYMSQPTENTTYTYRRGYVTNKYIYLLYYGKKEDNAAHIDGKTIYVFDWDGNPVKELLLDRYIQGFAITDNDSMIYAFDAEKQYVVRSEINWE